MGLELAVWVRLVGPLSARPAPLGWEPAAGSSLGLEQAVRATVVGALWNLWAPLIRELALGSPLGLELAVLGALVVLLVCLGWEPVGCLQVVRALSVRLVSC